MASLNHERVVKLLGVIMEDRDCSLVMELLPRGNLLVMLETVSWSKVSNNTQNIEAFTFSKCKSLNCCIKNDILWEGFRSVFRCPSKEGSS